MKQLLILSFLLLSCSSTTDRINYSTQSSKDVLKERLLSVSEEMSYCYGDGESSNKQISFVAKFQIISTGAVQNVSFSKNKLDQKTEICLKKQLLDLSFPKPHNGGFIDMTQPFNFFPSK